MKTKIEKDDGIDGTILECRLQILESYFKQLSHIQSQIERVVENDNTRSDMEESYVTTKTLILNKLKGIRQETNLDATILNQSRIDPPFTHRLPNLKLPKFDSKYSEYKRFISTFNNLVHNEPIPTIDKFNYLLNCLSDQALAAIEAFQVTEQNYTKALERLSERFDNKVLILRNHISFIFDIPSIPKADAVPLRKLIDNVAALRGSLLSLGSFEEILNAMMVHLIVSKLDPDSRNKYNEHQDFKEIPTLEKCYSILNRRCQFLENKIKPVENVGKNSQPQYKSNNTKRSTFVNTNPSAFCLYCNNSDHFINSCPSFLLLSATQRFDAAKQHALCLNCLRKGHFSSKCTSKSRFKKCNCLHHTILHFGTLRLSSNNIDVEHNLQPSTSAVAAHSTPVTLISRTTKRSFISTAVVLIRDHAGVFQPIRALLDSCSELNFITEEASKRLKLKWQYAQQEVSGIANVRTTITRFVNATIHSRTTKFEWTSSFAVTSTISSKQPGEFVDTKQWLIPSDLDLADSLFFSPRHIDLLIGTEVFFDLLQNGRILLGRGLPSLVNSVLGWVVGDSCFQVGRPGTFTCNVAVKSRDAALDDMLAKFWQIEEFQQSKHRCKGDERAESHFIENTKICSNGRLMILFENKLSLAICRRLHLVFDASAKSSSGISLNDTLLIGPTIQQDLIVTLLSFRLHEYALTADVSKMFRQFLVDERDRKFQMILWRDDPQQEIRTFGLNTLTYGLECAPFQAARCLFYIADLCMQKYPIASTILKEDFYVDDMLTGADTLEELHRKWAEISEAFKSFGLSLWKWNSNYHLFRAQDQQKLELNFDQASSTKALGTIWNVVDDTFCFKLPTLDITTPTKRTVLSTVARIFDILGLLSSIVIRLKILLQEMWIKQIGWDDPLPSNLLTVWSHVQEDLYNLNNITIPRFVFTLIETKAEIHGFADASQRAYGCCIYVRSSIHNSAKVSLLMVKSKVAPVQVQSLPRLELCAALLLASTWHKIRYKLDKVVRSVCFWLDLQIVRHWLQMHSSSLNCFVSNRVSEIQTQSRGIPWKCRKAVTFKCNNSGNAGCIINHIIHKHLSYMKILRILSYIFRIFNGVPLLKQLTINTILLTSAKLVTTFWKIVSAVQAQCFKDDISKLEANKEVSAGLRSLTPFVHSLLLDGREYRILRVGGRLLRAPIAFDVRFPALLPKQHRFTQLYIDFCIANTCTQDQRP